jgi:hypothetical protein
MFEIDSFNWCGIVSGEFFSVIENIKIKSFLPFPAKKKAPELFVRCIGNDYHFNWPVGIASE